ncbi:ATP-dependent zinc protease family protein [Stieleria varia]|uniref:Retropepsin-like aspartic endopeptidase domain-containing protein n=1 Tax=Stieleria varia TaxID=2528005 RepID=A0A5C6ASM6_9BACT|nr:RimK/LysX family protein [Stieleria varia]TWU02690.1 hypothetical protein Pla52n_37480 [Stieleria varia]
MTEGNPLINPNVRLLPCIGWREWVMLPSLRLPPIKAKIDTGARSSSLDAFNICEIEINGVPSIQFNVHPVQRSKSHVAQCVAPIHDIRSVRSSSGQVSTRFVIVTTVRWKRSEWEVELTLADRSKMGFRMLLGREALRGRLSVDPGRSFLGGRIKKRKKL